MNRVKPSIRSIIKIFGGKSYLCRRSGVNLISLFPDHKTYVSACAGGLNDLLNKPKSEVEIAAEINPALLNAWLSIQLRPNEILSSLKSIAHSEESFNRAIKGLKSVDFNLADPFSSTHNVFGAVSYIVVNRFSRSALGKDFGKSSRPRGGQNEYKNAWETMLSNDFMNCWHRIKDVDLIFYDFLQVIKNQRVNVGSTFVYIDPPYPAETRTAKQAYDFEMPTLRSQRKFADQTTHEDIIDYISSKKCRSMVLISSYRNDLYDTLLSKKGWWDYEFDMPNASGQTKVKQRRTEVVYGNYPRPF